MLGKISATREARAEYPRAVPPGTYLVDAEPEVGVKSPKMSHVEAACLRIDEVTCEIDEILKSLYRKLDNILSPAGAEDSAQCEAPIFHGCALTVCLHKHADKLYRIKNSLNEIIERTEL